MFAPDPRTGFEMVLLRLLAFVPARPEPSSAPGTSHNQLGAGGQNLPDKPGQARPAPSQMTQAAPQTTSQAASERRQNSAQTSGLDNNEKADAPLQDGLQNAQLKQFLKPASSIAQPEARDAQADAADAADEQEKHAVDENAKADLIRMDELVDDINIWSDFIIKSGLSGMTRQLAVHMTPQGFKGGVLSLVLDPQYKNLQSNDRLAEIKDVLQRVCEDKLEINIELGDVERKKTAAGVIAERERAGLEKTRQDFKEDDNVKTLVSMFDAQIDEASIKSSS